MHPYTNEQLDEMNRELRYAWHERFNYGRARIPVTNTGATATENNVNTRRSTYSTSNPNNSSKSSPK